MVYLDNAATTAMSEVALQALLDISKDQYGNPSSAYGFGRKNKEILEESRQIIADCIGADSEEIYFTSCGTESDNWAVSQGSHGMKKIITSQIEHHAVLHPTRKCEENGVKVIYIPVDRESMVSSAVLNESLDGTPVFVSVMFQNNETGAVQRICELAKMVHEDNENSIFHTDAVQAVGHIPIDVHAIGVDMLSASAHKFNGPKGIGFLYIKKGCVVNPYVLGGGQERGMRSGTENVASIYSMAMALQDNVKNLDEHRGYIQKLEHKFIEALKNAAIPYTINGDSAHRATGIINIAIKGIDGEGLLNMLDMHDICISIGSACNSKSQTRSHVLTAMGLDDEQIDSSVRISIGRYNSEMDVEALIKCIKRCYRVAALAEA